MRYTFTFLLSLAGICLQAQQKQSIVFYFDSGSAELTTSSRQEMDAITKNLETKNISSITVNGYTDQTGTEKYNQLLSLRRAATVAQLLKAFVPESISLSVNGFGASNLFTDKPEGQSLNRRVEIIIETHNTSNTRAATDTAPVVEVSPFQEDVPAQYFTINADDTVQINAKEGTSIRIDPGSLQNKKGERIHGAAQLMIKEYYQPSQIMLAGMHSISPQGLLQSGGMFYITVVQAGDTMAANTKKPVKIKLPKLYNELDDMNVYTSPHGRDSARWNNTGTLFTQLGSYWQKPYILPLADIPYEDDLLYTNLRVGRSYDDDERYISGSFLLGRYGRYRPLAKKIRVNVFKKDSVTVMVNAHIRYRRRGYRQLGKRTLDTSFAINYIRAQYEAYTGSMKWINCDRFYKSKNNTDFYVNTPGFRGLNVMVYFKDLHAFMPAQTFKQQYQVNGVPAGSPVTVVAVGKIGDDFYFGKYSSSVKQGLQAEINVEKMSAQDFRKEMKSL